MRNAFFVLLLCGGCTAIFGDRRSNPSDGSVHGDGGVPSDGALGDGGVTCGPGFADCNGQPGCETDITVGDNCGGCGIVCPSSAPLCINDSTGAHCGGSCPASAPTQCGSGCVDTQTDPAHCGSCTACPVVANASPLCVNGACQTSCNSGFHACGNACVDDTDVATCGASCTPCTAPANGTATCDGTSCGFTCNPGYVQMGSACQPKPTCTNGQFSCSTGCCGAVALSAGQEYTCAALSDGTARCWGTNQYGQLGVGDTGVHATPTAVSGLTGVTLLGAGYYDTCAIAGGALECWGDNRNGQDGNGTTSQNDQPVAVTGLSSGVTSVTEGRLRTCAVVNGGAKCWGWAQSLGANGDGTTVDRSTPVDVTGLTSGVTLVAAGQDHTCAILTSGAVDCWGSNNGGQLGTGNTNNSAVPVAVSGLTSGATALTGGCDHTCAVVSGVPKCWGYNDHYQTGAATPDGSNYQYTPAVITGWAGTATAVTAGTAHTCALTSTGGIKCWGSNTSGQLGRATLADSQPLGDVPSLTSGVSVVAAGYEHTCAILTGGGVMCWGANASGQLGDGTTTARSTPAYVNGN